MRQPGKRKEKGNEGQAASLVPAPGAAGASPGLGAPSGKPDPAGGPRAPGTSTLLHDPAQDTCFSAWLRPKVLVSLLSQAGDFHEGH